LTLRGVAGGFILPNAVKMIAPEFINYHHLFGVVVGVLVDRHYNKGCKKAKR